jgi:hypothetical protein
MEQDMIITVEIPEELASRLGADPAQLPRQALEALVLEGHRQGKLTEAETGRLLGFESRFQIDRFLKDHGVELAYTRDDLEYERQVHRELGSEPRR